MDYYREYLELSAALLLLEWDDKVTNHSNAFWNRNNVAKKDMEVGRARIHGDLSTHLLMPAQKSVPIWQYKSITTVDREFVEYVQDALKRHDPYQKLYVLKQRIKELVSKLPSIDDSPVTDYDPAATEFAKLQIDKSALLKRIQCEDPVADMDTLIEYGVLRCEAERLGFEIHECDVDRVIPKRFFIFETDYCEHFSGLSNVRHTTPTLEEAVQWSVTHRRGIHGFYVVCDSWTNREVFRISGAR